MDIGRETLPPTNTHTSQTHNTSYSGGLLLRKWEKPKDPGHKVKHRVGVRCDTTNENR